MLIKEMLPGNNTIDLMIKSIEDKSTKAGKSYITVVVTDGEKEITANMWNTSVVESNMKPGDVESFVLTLGEYNGQPNYTVVSYTPAMDADKKQFIKHSPIPEEKMYSEMIAVIKEFSDHNLTKLVGNLLAVNKEKLLTWGAAKSIHHNISGGLLYHMYRMMKQAQVINLYNINKDIVIAGVLVHDIGKLEELDTDMYGNSEYTINGLLFGHLFLGANMIKEMAKKCDTPEEITRQLMHIVISHHGKPEWGAITKPATTEAFLVHELDMIDSRLYQYEDALSDITPGSMSERIFSLDGVNVYNPRN